MSPRSRVVAVVALVATAAVGATVAGALVQGREAGGEVHGQTETAAARERAEPPALELLLAARSDRDARALRRAERLYEDGKSEKARAIFDRVARRDPDSLEAAIGAAVARWPDGTTERLEELADAWSEKALAHLNLGLALAAEGDAAGARTAWRTAERREPDSPAALRAEDLLHPELPPGRPAFLLETPRAGTAGTSDPAKRLTELERRARRGGARDWLLLGSALERVGRRVSAQGAYDRAVALAPGALAPRVAAAVSRFDKDEPSLAFSRLGPLSRERPRSAIVRFHLGLMLLWLAQVDEARRQLELAREAEPRGFYGRQAARVLDRLEEIE